MTILTTYGDFRANFAASPVTWDTDGMEVFICKADPSLMHTFRPWDSWDYDVLLSPGGIQLVGHEIDLTISGSFPSGQNDAAPFVDEWHWWVSDPGSAHGAARWEVVRDDPGGGATRSGRVTFQPTALGQSLLTGPAYLKDLLDALLTDVHIYARHIATNRVVWIDAHRCAYAPATFEPSWG